MPEITAHADVFRDWDSLIGGCVQNAALLPNVDSIRKELETILGSARELKIQQETLKGSRQAATQRLRELIAEGREVARKLRNQVKVDLGSKNEQLVQFGVAPIRKQVRRPKPVELPPPTGGKPTE